MFVNIYELNIGASKYIEQILTDLKGYNNYICSNIIIIGDFNIPLSSRDRLSRQKISK